MKSVIIDGIEYVPKSSHTYTAPESETKPVMPEWEIVWMTALSGGLHKLDEGGISCKKQGCLIHTVKRLSDETIWEVGDEVCWAHHDPFKITSFKIALGREEMLAVREDGLSFEIGKLKKVDKEWEWTISDGATIKEVIGEAIGGTSMCWNPTPTGIFDSTIAVKISESVTNYIQQQLDEEISNAWEAARLHHPLAGLKFDKLSDYKQSISSNK